GHLAFVGSRMTTALFALQLGASPFTVGALMSLFALLPVLLSVASGRLIDRVGPRRPLAAAFAALACGTALPFLFPSLQILFLSSPLLGLGFMCVHIGMNSVIGAHGAPEQRALNFSWLALGFSFSGSLGPLVAGYAIEGFGHAGAFLVLAFFPLLALGLLLAPSRPLPRPDHSARSRPPLALLRVPALRRTFLVTGIPATAWALGLGLGCAQRVIMALRCEASPPGRQGEAVGVRTTMINASSTFIPLASGGLSVVAGSMSPAFWLLAACLLAGAWFARRRVRSLLSAVVARYASEDANLRTGTL